MPRARSVLGRSARSWRHWRSGSSRCSSGGCPPAWQQPLGPRSRFKLALYEQRAYQRDRGPGGLTKQPGAARYD